MHGLANFGILRENFKKFIVHMKRMRARKADALDACDFANAHEQIAKINFFMRARKTFAVVIYVLPEQKYLFRPVCGGLFDLAQDQICGDGDLVAARVRDDAVGAFFCRNLSRY